MENYEYVTDSIETLFERQEARRFMSNLKEDCFVLFYWTEAMKYVMASYDSAEAAEQACFTLMTNEPMTRLEFIADTKKQKIGYPCLTIVTAW